MFHYFQLSVQRDLLRFAQVFSQMIHVTAPLRIHNVNIVNIIFLV